MSLQIVALIIVTAGFTALLLRMLSPRHKARFEALGRSVLDDDIPLDQPAAEE